MSGQSWEVWLNNGVGYEKAFDGNSKKALHFSAAIKYNLIALALEGYVMAMSSYHGSLPENHTFTDLIRAWEEVAPLDKAIKKVILDCEDVQSICSLENYKRFIPSDQEIRKLGLAVKKLGVIVKETVAKNNLGKVC